MNAAADFETFREAIAEAREGLPKRLRQCADFVALNPERVAFDTVAEVAVAAGVQPSAVMRFAQVMGFSGYSEMQKLVRSRFAQRWPDYRTRLHRMRETGAGTPEALLAEFVEAGRQSLARVTEQVSTTNLRNAVRTLSNSRMIHIAGYRRSFPVAVYLSYAFEKQGRTHTLLDGVGLLTRRPAMAAVDSLIAISFAPYTEETVEIVRHAHDAGAAIVAISDRADSPLFGLADHWLEVSEVDVGDFRTLTATFSLATTIAVAVGASEN
ncbi:MAG: MurR/RpiR family transcriptional regulator [Pseudomonadota bacterium]